jgi:hypothetical protein
MTKGQQAMALAMIYPEPNRTGRKDPVKIFNGSDPTASERVMLSQARTILRHSKELAEDVLTRGTHFDVAMKQVREGEQARKAHDQPIGCAAHSAALPPV